MRWSLVVVVTALLLLCLAPHRAQACGGMFCAAPQPQTPSAPAPVDQSAEQIVFQVNPDGETITAHVLISYVGSADDFAWIVPVPDVPEVEESSVNLFRNLNNNTQPFVTLPAAEACPPPQNNTADGGGGGFGCGSDDLSESASGSFNSGNAAQGTPSQPPVTVYAQGVTNNYSYDVVGAEDTATLITWLQDNGYNVSDNMSPVMSIYNGSQSKFLAVKLREGRSSTDIVPLAMTYAATDPMIPIQLTAVAAQPLMGILVFVIGDSPYTLANMNVVNFDTDEINFDSDGSTSYFEWVARVSDESGGQTFVREFVGSNPVEGTTFGDISRPIAGSTVSRFYTRMSPHHMTLDPVFQKDPGASNVTGQIDLSIGDNFRQKLEIWSRNPATAQRQVE